MGEREFRKLSGHRELARRPGSSQRDRRPVRAWL